MTNIDEYVAYDKYTKEMVKFKRVKCKCSHTICFIKNEPALCRYCGRIVYPSKECEFRYKLKKEIRRK